MHQMMEIGKGTFNLPKVRAMYHIMVKGTL